MIKIKYQKQKAVYEPFPRGVGGNIPAWSLTDGWEGFTGKVSPGSSLLPSLLQTTITTTTDYSSLMAL